MKWSRKSYTVVLIPDANRAVRRFNVSAAILFSLSLLFVLAVAVAALSSYLFLKNARQVDDLKQSLSAASQQYEAIISNKDNSIESLQTQVAGLSEQADSIRKGLNEVKQLESQVKQMVGISSGDNAVEAIDGMPADGGVGGEEIELTDQNMNELVSDTWADYGMIGKQIEELKTQLQSTKQAVLEEQEALRAVPTLWPTDSRRLTSLFGVRTDPFSKKARFHAGIDIGGQVGDPIYAAADGTVTLSEESSAEGLNIAIDHTNGIQTRYMHLSELIARKGDKVEKGEVIGLLGNTGRSTGPHLHFEVIANGEHADPLSYLKTTLKGK
ncbi:M23 family metallopeptidase [Cohnella algarum]|uniref:M23 family metallopeptidase n=1 Tax=Cohnella algarum TaxID=2044859 RepID=UPI001967157D|nr:M23 family metallopeptidase [Cohnella algarum]MBN2982576.1 peptidoglycan DD-metalloendopeptidase family protein [Cohnella algarum]